MSDTKVSVSAKALEELLRAVLGPPHYIRELQVTRGVPGLPNCVDQLLLEYNAEVERLNGEGK